jgi:hypothetical protein
MKSIITAGIILMLFCGERLLAQSFNKVPKPMLTSYFEEEKGSVKISNEKIIEICSRPEKSLAALETNEYNISGSAWIFVYDLLGNVIHNQRCNLEAGICEKVNMKNLSTGVYFLHITNGSLSITRKLVMD